MSDGLKKLDLLGNEAQRLTGERSTTEQAQAPARPQAQSIVPWEKMGEFKRLMEDAGMEIQSRINYDIIEKVSANARKQIDTWYGMWKDKNKQCQALRHELKMMRDAYGKLPKEKKQGGRKKKVVDWHKYDLLRQAGMSEKEIAEYMHIGASTLRRCKQERNQNGDGN